MFPFPIRRFRRGAPIVIVSGLPRSGTSMTMQMLDAGGVRIVTDGIRAADDENPRGYFELEAVKALHENADTSWLKDARGKAVKIISFLLTWLPETYDYRVIFMRRDLGEIVASQQKMLASRGEPVDPADAERMHQHYAQHLEEVARFLARRPCFSSLDVEYRRALEHPREQAGRIAAFLGGRLNIEAMASAVDPRLHRNRHH